MPGLFSMLFVILILIGVFWFLKNYKEPQEQKPRFFKGASFSKIRRELDKGKLHKDPISGTFVSESDAIVVIKDGKKHYFASEENAEKFRHGERGE